MQNRYAGDIGDYVKLALLRALAPGHELGVAWYLNPDEGHNSDGRHIAYLRQGATWRDLDPELFDALGRIVRQGRSVAALETSGVLPAKFSRALLNHGQWPADERSKARAQWFDRTIADLSGCDLVFADPDNGLTDDRPERRCVPRFGKHLPLCEALRLAEGRCAVLYHHNSRFKGGHDAEVEHWRRQLGPGTNAIRATAFSCRTFFVVNPSRTILGRMDAFAQRWSGAKVRLHD